MQWIFWIFCSDLFFFFCSWEFGPIPPFNAWGFWPFNTTTSSSAGYSSASPFSRRFDPRVPPPIPDSSKFNVLFSPDRDYFFQKNLTLTFIIYFPNTGVSLSLVASLAHFLLLMPDEFDPSIPPPDVGGRTSRTGELCCFYFLFYCLYWYSQLGVLNTFSLHHKVESMIYSLN